MCFMHNLNASNYTCLISNWTRIISNKSPLIWTRCRCLVSTHKAIDSEEEILIVCEHLHSTSQDLFWLTLEVCCCQTFHFLFVCFEQPSANRLRDICCLLTYGYHNVIMFIYFVGNIFVRNGFYLLLTWFARGSVV